MRLKLSSFKNTGKSTHKPGGRAEEIKGRDQKLFSTSFSLAEVLVEDEVAQASSTWQTGFFFLI